MNRAFFAGLAVCLAIATAASAATPINGSMSLNGGSVTQNGVDLSVSTSISATQLVPLSAGFGHYSPVPLFTDFGPISIDLTNEPTGFGFSMSNATYGSFTATYGQIVSQSANFMDLYLSGPYTPGLGLLPADMATETSLRISINQSGNSLTLGASLSSPAVPPPNVPEPATLALFGGGLAVLLAGRRRR